MIFLNCLHKVYICCSLYRQGGIGELKEVRLTPTLLQIAITALLAQDYILKLDNHYALTQQGLDCALNAYAKHLSIQERLILRVLKQKRQATLRQINKWSEYNTLQNLNNRIRRLEALGYIKVKSMVSKSTLRSTNFFSLTELGNTLV